MKENSQCLGSGRCSHPSSCVELCLSIGGGENWFLSVKSCLKETSYLPTPSTTTSFCPRHRPESLPAPLGGQGRGSSPRGSPPPHFFPQPHMQTPITPCPSSDCSKLVGKTLCHDCGQQGVLPACCHRGSHRRQDTEGGPSRWTHKPALTSAEKKAPTCRSGQGFCPLRGGPPPLHSLPNLCCHWHTEQAPRPPAAPHPERHEARKA